MLLEILIVFRFCGKLGEKIRAKGHSPSWYQLLFVVLFGVGYLLGGFAGVVVSLVTANTLDGANLLFLYIFALVGAGLGGFIPFWIADQLPDRNGQLRTLQEQPYYIPGRQGDDDASPDDAYRGAPDDRLQK